MFNSSEKPPNNKWDLGDVNVRYTTEKNKSDWGDITIHTASAKGVKDYYVKTGDLFAAVVAKKGGGVFAKVAAFFSVYLTFWPKDVSFFEELGFTAKELEKVPLPLNPVSVTAAAVQIVAHDLHQGKGEAVAAKPPQPAAVEASAATAAAAAAAAGEKPVVGTGLERLANLGATCYINSSIHLMRLLNRDGGFQFPLPNGRADTDEVMQKYFKEVYGKIFTKRFGDDYKALGLSIPSTSEHLDPTEFVSQCLEAYPQTKTLPLMPGKFIQIGESARPEAVRIRDILKAIMDKDLSKYSSPFQGGDLAKERQVCDDLNTMITAIKDELPPAQQKQLEEFSTSMRLYSGRGSVKGIRGIRDDLSIEEKTKIIAKEIKLELRGVSLEGQARECLGKIEKDLEDLDNRLGGTSDPELQDKRNLLGRYRDLLKPYGKPPPNIPAICEYLNGRLPDWSKMSLEDRLKKFGIFGTEAAAIYKLEEVTPPSHLTDNTLQGLVDRSLTERKHSPNAEERSLPRPNHETRHFLLQIDRSNPDNTVIETSIDLTKEVKIDGKRFRVKAATMKWGRTTRSGHHTAVIREGDAWYHHNDTLDPRPVNPNGSDPIGVNRNFPKRSNLILFERVDEEAAIPSQSSDPGSADRKPAGSGK